MDWSDYQALSQCNTWKRSMLCIHDQAAQWKRSSLARKALPPSTPIFGNKIALTFFVQKHRPYVLSRIRLTKDP